MIRVNLIVLACVTFLCLASPSCILFDEYPSCPTVFEGDSARNKFESLRNSLSVNGVTFFDDRVYLSTSSAILEFTGERLDRLYKCRRADWDSFDRVGVDRISRNLWFESERDRRLLKFDGSKWSSQSLPALPEPEYYSRGDAIAGFNGFNYDGKFLLLNTHRFWLPNGRRAWSYETSNSWSPFDFPASAFHCNLGNPDRLSEKGCLREIGPIGDELCAVLHGDLIGQDIARGESVRDEFTPQPDIVTCMRGGSWRVLNPEGTPEFFSDKVVSRNNAMFTTTRAGKISRITKTGPESVATLGEVEALTVSSEGNLLVWFSGKGIYELRGEWIKLFDVPFEPKSNLKGSLIEENAGIIVVAASPPLDPEARRPAPDLVWIMKEGRVVQIL